MIFKDIKPGDKVLAPVEVHMGWDKRRFNIPRTVSRTTATQFVVGRTRYRKENGKKIGGSGFTTAYPLSRTDKDESEAHAVYAARADAVALVREEFHKLNELVSTDTVKNISADRITKAATLISSAIYELKNDAE